MSDSLAPGEIVATQIDIGAAGSQRSISDLLIRGSLTSRVRPLLIAGMAWCLLLGAGPAFAQVEDPLTATPPLGVTTPLGMNSGGSIGPAGIPLDSTEITSLGVSPAPTGGVTGTISIPTTGTITSNGTSCPTVGTSSAGMYGSTATYDGGGTAAGTATPATAATSGAAATAGTSTSMSSGTSTSPGTTASTGMSGTSAMSTSSGMLDTSGMSGMCGSGAGSIASSSTPTSTSPTTPGGFARTGIPMDSTELSNPGVSSAAAIPTAVSPMMGA